MRTTLDKLSSIERGVLAGIRMSLAVSLASEVASFSPELLPIKPVSFRLALKTIGLPQHAEIAYLDGKVKARFSPIIGWSPPFQNAKTPLSGSLVFLGTKSCIRSLSGSKGCVIPLPLQTRFMSALKFFSFFAAKVPNILKDPKTPVEIKAKLLIAATMSGLVAVALDPYLFPRLDHIPDGVLGIEVGKYKRKIEKKGRIIEVLELTPDYEEAKPSAILSFASEEFAVSVLSGQRPAIVALGAGEVRIAGFLPLVQGLFSLMDRLSWYLEINDEVTSR